MFVFHHQPHMARRIGLLAHPLGQFLEKIRVFDGMHRVQAQAVKTVLQQPHQGVVDEEVAHLAPTEIDGRSPRRVPVFAEEPLGVAMQVIAIRPEVVVDHVENHRQAKAMGGVDQVLELFGRTIGGLGCIEQHPVVAPIALAGKLRDRHQLDRGDPKLHQVRQVLLDGQEAAEGTDVQLVDHRFVPRASQPGAVPPWIGQRVDHHAVLVNVPGLGAGGRVGHLQFAIDVVAVSRTRRAAGVDHEPAVGLRQQRQGLSIFQFDTDVERIGCPQRESRVLRVQFDCAVGPGLKGP